MSAHTHGLTYFILIRPRLRTVWECSADQHLSDTPTVFLSVKRTASLVHDILRSYSFSNVLFLLLERIVSGAEMVSFLFYVFKLIKSKLVLLFFVFF